MFPNMFISRKPKDNCSTIRHRLAEMVAAHLTLDSDWVTAHVTQCPRCRRRLTGYNRLAAALAMVKSAPHALDLLSRANAQAIAVLQRPLRESPQAQKLKTARVNCSLPQKFARYSQGLTHAAACIAILLLMRFTIPSSIEKGQRQGRAALKHYYAHHLGQETADQMLPS